MDPDESIRLEKCCLNTEAFPDALTISPPTPSAIIFTTLIPYEIHPRVQVLSAVGGMANSTGATLRLGLYDVEHLGRLTSLGRYHPTRLYHARTSQSQPSLVPPSSSEGKSCPATYACTMY